MARCKLIAMTVLALAQVGFATDAAPALEEKFGPLIAPMHVIDAPPGLDSSTASGGSTIHVLPDGKALSLGVEPRANVWEVIVFFWPELAMAALLLLLLWPAWRIWRVMRRPQAVGQPHCRRCNYQLTGITSSNCPECGAELTSRNRMTGKARKRRLVPALVIAGGLAGSLTALVILWEPPSAVGGWTMEPVLPRDGRVSTWFRWYSGPVYRWCQRNKVKLHGWLDGDSQDWAQLWQVDLRGGKFETLRHEYPLENWVVSGVPDSPQFRIIDGELTVTDRNGWQVIDRKTGGLRPIHAFDPSNDPKSDDEQWARRFSVDRRFLFDNLTYEALVAWDPSIWHYYEFPVPVPAGSKRLAVTGMALIAGESAAVIRYHPSASGKEALVAWWPATGQLQPMPVEWLGYRPNMYAFAGEQRFLVGEQVDWHGNEPFAWDLKTNAALPDIDQDSLGKIDGQFPDLVLVAVSKREGKAYLFGRNTSHRWYEWNLATGKAAAMNAPPTGELTWVRRIEDVLDPPLIASERTDGWGIEINERKRAEVKETIEAPAPVGPSYQWSQWDDSDIDLPLSPDKRFVAGISGASVVVFDRKRRRWIGRFGDATLCSGVFYARWSDGGRLLIVIGEGEANHRILVFDMERFQ